MPDPLRYTLVGTGGDATHWWRFALPRLHQLGKATPVAAVDALPDNLRNAQQYLALPAEYCFTSVEEAFDRRTADFAIIAMPPMYHDRIIEQALLHDMHILLEPPIADTMQAAVRIYRKAMHARKKLALAMGHRLDPDKQTLQQLIQDHEFGRLHYLVARLTQNCRARGGWGWHRYDVADPLLVEAAVHHFDTFRALTGADARTVHAFSWNPPWAQFKGDSTSLATIEMLSGVHCQYEGAMANAASLSPWTEDYVRAECERATVELDRRRIRALRGEAWAEPHVTDIPLLDAAASGTARSAELFCDWLAGGDKHPTRLKDAMQTAALVFAAVESAHTGKAVDVQAFLTRHLAA